MKKDKIHQIFSTSLLKFALLIILTLFLSNCGKSGECIQESTTGGLTFNIDATNNGQFAINQGYSHTGTTQRAGWYDIQQKTNGEAFVIDISGDWMAWYGDEHDESKSAIFPDHQGGNVFSSGEGKVFCTMNTVNKGSEAIDKTGEFNYVTDVYSLHNNNLIPLTPKSQRTCWLYGGEGLYIGFFGADGFQMPSAVHHLGKREQDSIKCESAYRHDENLDGLISFNECYNYLCPSEYSHDENANGKIDTGECYSEESSGPNIIKIVRGEKKNKAVVRYITSGFTRTVDGDLVREGEVVKLMVLDKYYGDNMGSYNITFYSGLGSRTKGTFERIIEAIEAMFVGEKDEDGRKIETSVIYKIYNKIILDTTFSTFVRVIVILYMTFFGFGIFMGSIKLNKKELLFRLFKLALILYLTSPGGWKLFSDIVMDFFFGGLSFVIAILQGIIRFSIDPTYTMDNASIVAIMANSKGFANASNFAFVDSTFELLLNPFSATSLARKIPALIISVWYGPILVILLYAIIIVYLYTLMTMIYPYILLLIQASLVLSLSPIFILFYLFKKTEHMFKAWLVFVSARFFEICLLFVFLSIMNSYVISEIQKFLNFDACYVPIKTLYHRFNPNTANLTTMIINLFGADVSILHTTVQKGFLEFSTSLFTILVVVMLFRHLTSKLPQISNSIFQVWGQGNRYSGGGLGEREAFSKDVRGLAKKIGKKYGGIAGKALDAFVSVTEPVLKLREASEYVKKGINIVKSPLKSSEDYINKKIGIENSKMRLYQQGKIDALSKDLKGKEAEQYAHNYARKKAKGDVERSLLKEEAQYRRNLIKNKDVGKLSYAEYLKEIRSSMEKDPRIDANAFTDRDISTMINAYSDKLKQMEENEAGNMVENLRDLDVVEKINNISDPVLGALDKTTELTDEEKENISIMQNILHAPDLLEQKENVLKLDLKEKKESDATKKDEIIKKKEEIQKQINKQKIKIKKYQLALEKSKADKDVNVIKGLESDINNLNKSL